MPLCAVSTAPRCDLFLSLRPQSRHLRVTRCERSSRRSCRLEISEQALAFLATLFGISASSAVSRHQEHFLLGLPPVFDRHDLKRIERQKNAPAKDSRDKTAQNGSINKSDLERKIHVGIYPPCLPVRLGRKRSVLRSNKTGTGPIGPLRCFPTIISSLPAGSPSPARG